MKQLLLAGTALAAASSAWAGNLDRSGQKIGILFEEGSYAEFSLGYVSPSLSGADLAAFGGAPTGDVGDSYIAPGAAFKADINDAWSYAVIYDQPFGAAIDYGPSSLMLGGTSAFADTNGLTGILRYQFGDAFSLHGGIRLQSIEAQVGLQGLAYGGLSGYAVDFDRAWAAGALIGAAYEIPDIALRAAITWNSAINYAIATQENIAPGVTSTTDVTTPQSVNIDLQTGIAADTLLFGSIRWVDWTEFTVAPQTLDSLAGPLVSYDEDITTYTLGVGRQFTDAWSGAIQVGYEAPGDSLVSPLGPWTGATSVGGGVTYATGNSEITAGVSYTWLGDAQAEVGGTAVADFTDNSAIAAGIRYGFRF